MTENPVGEFLTGEFLTENPVGEFLTGGVFCWRVFVRRVFARGVFCCSSLGAGGGVVDKILLISMRIPVSSSTLL